MTAPGMKTLAKQLLSGGQIGELLTFMGEKERAHLDLAEELAADFGVEAPTPLGAGDYEAFRAEQLRDGLMALAESDFPAFHVRQVFETYADDDTTKGAAEAMAYADMTADEFEDEKAAWAEGWRERGLEGTDEELASAHVTTRYGLELATFQRYVVGCANDGDALETFLGGEPYEQGRETYVYLGLTTAETYLEHVKAEALDRHEELRYDLKAERETET